MANPINILLANFLYFHKHEEVDGEKTKKWSGVHAIRTVYDEQIN